MPRALLLLSVAAVVFGLLAMGRLGTIAQDGTPAADGQELLGSWVVTIEVEGGLPFTVLQTYESGGTVTSGGLPAFRADPTAPVETLYSSTGVGAWEGTGPDAYAGTVVILYGDVDGNLLATETVRWDLEIDGTGNAFSGMSSFVGTDPAGATLYAGTATFRGTRITVQEPGTPVAMPIGGEASAAATPAS